MISPTVDNGLLLRPRHLFFLKNVSETCLETVIFTIPIGVTNELYMEFLTCDLLIMVNY